MDKEELLSVSAGWKAAFARLRNPKNATVRQHKLGRIRMVETNSEPYGTASSDYDNLYEARFVVEG